MTQVQSISAVTKDIVEQLLYTEAELLDAWQLDEWLQLLTEQCGYFMPSNDIPEGNHREHLFLVADDYDRLKARVKRLKSRFAHIENPHSKTRRMISNIRIKERTEDTITVKSNFIVYRFRRFEQVAAYVGEYTHRFKLIDGTLKIDERRAVLDAEEIGSLGTVSILL